jgi:hypothetical protein
VTQLTNANPKRSSLLSPACGILSWATGWKRMSGFLTRCGADHSRDIKERVGWRTPGRSSANPLASGRWKTISGPAGV